MTYLTVKEMKQKKRELGYSYEKIADLSGVPVSTVRKVLGGSTKAPRSTTLQALSRAFLQDPVSKDGAGYHYPVDTHNYEPQMVRAAEPAYGFAKKQGEYTLEDYLALPDERRVELIDGVIYDMSAPTGYHQLIAGQLYSTLLSWIRGKKGSCMPFISPVDVQLDCDDKTIVQPDVLIVCDRDKLRKFGIYGAPDFILEILSPSTRLRDLTQKAAKYGEAGVREYWIIDPKKKVLLTYDFTDADFIPVIRPLEGAAEVMIYGGELRIDLKPVADCIEEFG